jgi:hypothetical protein
VNGFTFRRHGGTKGIRLMDHRLAIIIRTAGERTAGICRDLVVKQAPWATVEVIGERPFEAALRKSYETAIQINAPWTMTVDGDVLLRRRAVQDFLDAAEDLPSDFIQIEGRIHDKILGTYRQAGHRIYRTSLLPRALELVPNPGTEIRPEFSVLHKMALLGHPSRRIGMIMGIHDYEQYYRDLYRKAFVHAKKHPELVPHFVARAKKTISNDVDFLVLLRGLWNGVEHRGAVRIDIQAFGNIEPILAGMGLQEKSELPPGAVDFNQIDCLLRQAAPPERLHYYDLQTKGEWTQDTGPPKSQEPTAVQKVAAPRQLARSVCMTTGSYLSVLGERLKCFGSRKDSVR